MSNFRAHCTLDHGQKGEILYSASSSIFNSVQFGASGVSFRADCDCRPTPSVKVEEQLSQDTKQGINPDTRRKRVEAQNLTQAKLQQPFCDHKHKNVSSNEVYRARSSA